MPKNLKEKRKVVLNNTLYEITEGVYSRLYKKLGKKIKLFSEKQYQEQHQRRCNLIRKHGKIIGELDLILRDD